MEWLLILGLLAWAIIQSAQLSGLRGRADALERRVNELRDWLNNSADDATPAAKPSRKAQAETAQAPPEPAARPATAARVETPPAMVARPPRPLGPPMREVVRDWLEANGLAWAGGAALALGGLFLVTYAAQRGVFTPPFRIGAAVVVGALLLGVSEWLKRREGQGLAGSLSAGAGAATLYGAAWASYWLYDFIGLEAAGGLLAAISFGLLALAFRHGEPLAVLAILGGFLAPIITGPAQWSAPALTAFLALLLATGYAVAAARAWGLTGMATLVGAFGWAVAGFAAEDNVRVVALALGPVALAYAAVEWRRRRSDSDPRGLFGTLPDAALAAAAAILMASWFAAPRGPWIHAAGTGAVSLALLAALGDRRRLTAPVLQGLGYLPALGFMILQLRTVTDRATQETWGAALVAAMAAAGVVAATGRRERVSRFGAAGAGLAAVLLAVTLRGPVTHDVPWAAATAAAFLLLGGAVVIARRSEDPARDLPLAVWLWASGGGAIYALQQGVDIRFLPPAFAGLSLAGALLHARLGWRGFAAVMVGSATASLAALISPSLFAQLEDGRMDWPLLAVVAAASAGLACAGAWTARRSNRPPESADAQGTAALVIAIAGVGVLLRLWATAGVKGGGGIDLFLEAALRTVLILTAGLTAAQAVRADSSVIGRWRGQVLLLAGLAHGILLGVLTLNPLGAWWKPAVAGPPILDSLAVGYLAPAVLLGFATWKKVSVSRWLLAVCGLGAALFFIVWELMELRRLFQGASLHGGLDAIGRAEAAAYALAMLGAALTSIWVGERAAKRPWTVSAFAGEIVLLGRLSGWFALTLAVLVFGWAASPWWGPIDRPLAGLRATALLLALYAAGGSAAYLVAQAAHRGGAAPLARAGRLVVVGIAFALLNIVTRLVFRGYDMRPRLGDASLETWTFSAVWGLYGFGLLIWGVARRSNDLRGAGMVVLLATLAKIFLFDMSRLDGVVRAGSFLAVGALMMAAAVLVRRLSGAAALPFARGRRVGDGRPLGGA